ncbi:MAG: AIR synthase related protein [Acidimicrobiia bacterium]
MLLGPAIGEDACVIEVPKGAVIVATDPITLTSRAIGKLGVIINGNDVAVMGVRPRWFLAVILLPPGSSPGVVREIFATMRDGLDELGAFLVGGHTEVTQAVTQPVLIGQMIGVSGRGRFVSTGGARPGDVLVQVGRAPVEGTALLASEAADRLGSLPAKVLEAARGAFEDPGVSIVEPALLAAELGATAMHDPTEGGLAAGLHEIGIAAGVALSIDTEAILWFEPGLAVCEMLDANPWATLASGTLMATFPRDSSDRAIGELTDRGHDVAVIGSVRKGAGVWDQTGAPIPWLERDEVARTLEGRGGQI